MGTIRRDSLIVFGSLAVTLVLFVSLFVYMKVDFIRHTETEQSFHQRLVSAGLLNVIQRSAARMFNGQDIEVSDRKRLESAGVRSIAAVNGPKGVVVICSFSWGRTDEEYGIIVSKDGTRPNWMSSKLHSWGGSIWYFPPGS